MPYTLLKGRFKPGAGIPDGDSVRFAPDDPSPLFTLPRKNRRPRVNRNNGTVQLRYEGIDSVETDAKEPFATDATKKNLKLIGLEDANDEIDGHILANQIGPNGRPICFVYAGSATEEDGASVFLDVARMKESVNYKIIEAGTAYPLFYDTLFADLRDEMAAATKAARSTGVGLWPADRTSAGVEWGGSSSLPNLAPIFPKLWRRLEKYTQNRDFRDESSTLEAFTEFLETSRDRLVVISESRATDFDNVVVVEENRVRLPVLPEDMFFLS